MAKNNDCENSAVAMDQSYIYAFRLMARIFSPYGVTVRAMAVVLWMTVCDGNTKGEELRDLIDRHASSRDAIRTLQCDLERRHRQVEDANKGTWKETIVTGKYTRSERSVRFRYHGGPANQDLDICVSGGSSIVLETKTRSSGQREDLGSISIEALDKPLTESDPWCLALLNPMAPGSIKPVTLEQMLTSAKKVKVDHPEYKGRKIDRLTLVVPSPTVGLKSDWEVEIWLDSSMNHLIRQEIRRATLANGKAVKSVVEILDVSEPTPGVIFPARIHQLTTIDGRDQVVIDSTLSSLRINDQMPPEMFRLLFPQGTKVVDNVKRVSYTVGSNNTPTSRPVPLSSPSQRSVRKEPSQSDKLSYSEPMASTISESSSIWPRITVISLAVLVIAIVARLWRRRIGTRTEP